MVGSKLGRNRERELRFAQNALRQVAPALYSIYLFRRLRSRAGAMERARVARELHDTAIQSLISIEMQVDVLRRRSNGHLPGGRTGTNPAVAPRRSAEHAGIDAQYEAG